MCCNKNSIILETRRLTTWATCYASRSAAKGLEATTALKEQLKAFILPIADVSAIVV